GPIQKKLITTLGPKIPTVPDDGPKLPTVAGDDEKTSVSVEDRLDKLE
ncbi:4379_t:CDS:1, partial [Ambispora gerdemannii]